MTNTREIIEEYCEQKFANDAARKRASAPKFQVYNSALRNIYTDLALEQAAIQPKEWGRYIESAIGAHIVSQAFVDRYDVYYWREGNDEVDYILQKKSLVLLRPRVARACLRYTYITTDNFKNLIICCNIDKQYGDIRPPLPQESHNGRLCLLVDTGDEQLNRAFCGYVQVITGYNRSQMWRVEC